MINVRIATSEVFTKEIKISLKFALFKLHNFTLVNKFSSFSSITLLSALTFIIKADNQMITFGAL